LSDRQPYAAQIDTQETAVAIDRWGWGSLGINVVLVMLNLSIAVASGSLAVFAELVHNLVDLAASVAMLVGLKLSQRQSQAFPYGLYKVENVVAVGMAGLVFFTGYEILREVLIAPTRLPTVNPIMLIGMAISAILPWLFSVFELRAGKAANSPSLVANAREYRVHLYSSGIVLLALLSQLFALPFPTGRFPVDGIAALFVVVFIARTGWELLRDGMRVLLDASLDAPTLAHVRQIVEADPATVQVKALTGRNSGRYRFLETTIALRVHDLNRAHQVAERIEQAIRKQVPHIERVLVHYEPQDLASLRYAFPLTTPEGVVSEHLGDAPYFALITRRSANGAIEKQEVIANPHRDLTEAKGIRVAEWLVSQKVDRVVLKEDFPGKGPGYVFADAGVQVLRMGAESIGAALAEVST
jgi:cation diffusion facilitator family transporter